VTARTRVLVIDDAAEIRFIARYSLSRFGDMDVLEAASALGGLELAREQRPDAILLDLRLPDLPGRDALARLRADPATAAIPVIVLSAVAEDPAALAALGASAVVRKPFDPLALPARVRAALADIGYSGSIR
jgi:CheY-like chemotaxis protein